MWNKTFKKETMFAIFGEPWPKIKTVKDKRSIKKQYILMVSEEKHILFMK